MGFRSPICCWRQKVRVVEANGQVRRYPFPISVPDLLRLYPRHYLRHVSGSILAPDAELEGGDTYMLWPLPNLFPCCPATSSSCPDECMASKRQRESNPQRRQGSTKCEGYQRKRRVQRKMWEPSLDIISENAMLLQTKQDECNKSDKKTNTQTLKYRLENSAFKKEPWYMQKSLSIAAGFIF